MRGSRGRQRRPERQLQPARKQSVSSHRVPHNAGRVSDPFRPHLMKTMAAVFLAVFTVMTAEAGPQRGRSYIHHDSAFRSQSSATHFIARSGNGFHRRFHYGSGGVIIFDPPDDGGDYGLPDDDTVYQGAVAPRDAESLPYATPTSDPE